MISLIITTYMNHEIWSHNVILTSALRTIN